MNEKLQNALIIGGIVLVIVGIGFFIYSRVWAGEGIVSR